MEFRRLPPYARSRRKTNPMPDSKAEKIAIFRYSRASGQLPWAGL